MKSIFKLFSIILFVLVGLLPRISASIEDVQSYWDNRPCNLKHSKQAVGSREYFEEVERRKYFVEPHIPNFAQFKRWEGKEVLEIGCGIGTDSINFARAGAKLTIVELSKKSIEIAKKRFEIYGLKANFIEGDAENLSHIIPNSLKKFDLVYSFGVIHHTPHPEKITEETLKVLKPDGEFRLMLYAKHSIKNYMIYWGLDQPEAQSGCPIAQTYTGSEVTKLLSGFDVVYSWKDHIFPYDIEQYKNYNYVIKFPWNFMPTRLFNFLESMLGWHFLIVAKPKI
jgi:SAM-dependent methyltransferase